MMLYLDLQLSIGGNGITKNGRLAMASDWAITVAKKIRDRKEATDTQNAVLLEKRNLLLEQAPRLWSEIFSRVQVLVSEFNAECKCEGHINYVNVSTTKFQARLKTEFLSGELIAEFAPGNFENAVRWNYLGSKGKTSACSFEVSPSGKVEVFFDKRPTTADAVAETMLNGLFEE